MQSAAPEAVDLTRESESTKALYGLDNNLTRSFGTQCLSARRLVERGVRFVQLYHGGGGDGWDTHGGNDSKHLRNGRQIDKPITALITDLKARGLLDSTLIIWGGEFDARPLPKGPMAGITAPTVTPSGWRVEAFGAARSMERPMISDSARPRTRFKSVTCMPRSCTCSAYSTTSSPTTSKASSNASLKSMATVG